MRQLLFTCDGRIARGRFWIGNLILLAGFVALLTITSVVGAALSAMYGDKANAPAAISLIVLFILFLAYSALAVWAGVCLGIKRFHDRDKPAIWVCIQFIPLIGGIWYLVEAGFLKGTSGPNRYGVDPPGAALAPGTARDIPPLPPLAGQETSASSAGLTGGVRQEATGVRPGWVLPLMLILTLPAAAILVGGLVTGWRTQHWMETTIKVDGTVTGLTPGNSGSKAIVDAKTPYGTPIHITDFWAISPAPKIGATWTVAYQPGHPDEAVIVGFFRQYGVALLLDTIGGAIVIGWLFVTMLVAFLWARAPTQAEGRPVI